MLKIWKIGFTIILSGLFFTTFQINIIKAAHFSNPEGACCESGPEEDRFYCMGGEEGLTFCNYDIEDGNKDKCFLNGGYNVGYFGTCEKSFDPVKEPENQKKLDEVTIAKGKNNNGTSGLSGGLKGCCVLRNKITIGNVTCEKGTYVPKNAESSCPGTACENTNENNWGMFCVLNTVYSITSWLFLILMSAVILMIVYGGFLYLVSQGLPERTKKAKQILTFAIIGLIVALLAKIIPSLVKFVMGVSS